MDDLIRQQLTGLVIFLLLIVMFLSLYFHAKFSDNIGFVGNPGKNYSLKKARFYFLLAFACIVMTFITMPGIWW